jgi:hypothetical protein
MGSTSDRAIYNLQNSDLCAIDPWIASALISIADMHNLKTKYLNKAFALSNENNLSEFSRSELKSSLGTIELRHGANKAAKRLFRQSLVDPTENALAQARWMTKKFGLDSSLVVEQSKKVTAPFESNSWVHYYNKRFIDCINEALLWASFDSLNPEPVILASFVESTFLENDNKTLQIIDNATPVQKADPTVINNKVFSLIELGRLEEGIAILNKQNILKLPDRDKLTFIATLGFAAFRSGNSELGRKYYQTAISGFINIGEPINATVAKYYYAREEKRLNSEFSYALISDVKDEIKGKNIFAFDELSNKL